MLSSVHARTAVATLLVALLVATATSAGAAPLPVATSDASCVPSAAVTDATIEVVAGRRTIVVDDPVLIGGGRTRLLGVGEAWCDATAVNTWLAAGATLTTEERALAAATVLATPNFVDLRWSDVRTVDGTVHAVSHARTNGVVAEWTVVMDQEGLREARWTAVDFAVPPVAPDHGGLTALPGASMGFRRGGDGLVHAVDDPLSALDQPEIVTRGTASDGFEILVSAGDTTISPDLEDDTGIREADFYRSVRDWSLDNYEEFLLWGLDNRLPGAQGTVFVDDALSLFCIACTVATDTFNVHLSSQAVYFQSQLGMHYTEEALGFRTILGHEIFHNVQHGYAELSGNESLSPAFAEGTARMQESLHLYSEASYIPGSPLYQRSAQGCNGFQGNSPDKAFGEGPFNGHAEDACLFWMSWYGRNGIDRLVRLLEESATGGPTGSDFSKTVGGLGTASGRSLSSNLLTFAVSAITGQGYGWRSPSDEFSEYRDWGAHLARWHVRQLPVGNRYDRTLGDGGVMAAEITGSASLDFRGPVDAHLITVTDHGSVHVEKIPSRRQVHVGADERAFVVLLNPDFGSVSATILWGMAPNANDEWFGPVTPPGARS